MSYLIERLNDRRQDAVENGEDAGFTLIELMVVLLILAILLAIAIPTFLGVTGGANDRAAQSNINTALTTAKAAETQNNQTYTGITAASLHGNEPSINFVSGAPSAVGDVSVYFASDGNGVVLSSWSKSDTCWYAVDNVGTVTDTGGPYTAGGSPATTSPGTQYGKKSGVNTAATCDATAALTSVTWQSSKFPS